MTIIAGGNPSYYRMVPLDTFIIYKTAVKVSFALSDFPMERDLDSDLFLKDLHEKVMSLWSGLPSLCLEIVGKLGKSLEKVTRWQ